MALEIMCRLPWDASKLHFAMQGRAAGYTPPRLKAHGSSAFQVKTYSHFLAHDHFRGRHEIQVHNAHLAHFS